MNGRLSGPVALLVDADNLSSPELVQQALAQLTQLAGPVSIRRAYGSAENLKGLAATLREGAFQPCLNLPLGKNTTDIALAVDAMDLSTRHALAVVAIGTGDADFAPLALRLRERGVRTVCFSQANKMAPEVQAFYDEVVLLGAPRRAAVAASPVAAPTVATPVLAAAPVPRKPAALANQKAPARKTAAKSAAKSPAKSAAAPKASAQTAADVELGERVRDLLRGIPGVAEGDEVPYGEVTQQLRAAKLLGRGGAASRLLKKHVPGVQLTPEAQPRKLRCPDAA